MLNMFKRKNKDIASVLYDTALLRKLYGYNIIGYFNTKTLKIVKKPKSELYQYIPIYYNDVTINYGDDDKLLLSRSNDIPTGEIK